MHRAISTQKVLLTWQNVRLSPAKKRGKRRCICLAEIAFLPPDRPAGSAQESIALRKCDSPADVVSRPREASPGFPSAAAPFGSATALRCLLTQSVLMTAAPLSFHCSIQLDQLYQETPGMSISGNGDFSAENEQIVGELYKKPPHCSAMRRVFSW